MTNANATAARIANINKAIAWYTDKIASTTTFEEKAFYTNQRNNALAALTEELNAASAASVAVLAQ